MGLLAMVFMGIVAALHVYFMVLEMFLWASPKGLQVFGHTLEYAQSTKALAANQGLYNGFLAAGLIWSLFYPSPEVARHLAMFFLACVLVAGVYGGATASTKIFFVQALPAVVTLALVVWLRPS